MAEQKASQSVKNPQDEGKGSSYYDQGSVELATESALTLSKIQERLILTKTADRLVIALVGLPGRGKSFISHKLQNLLTWRGSECKIFNVGKYTKLAEGKNNSADFFDHRNESAMNLREKIAALALNDLLAWLDAPFEQNCDNVAASAGKCVKDRVAIFDGTNLTRKRRDWVLKECTCEEKRATKQTSVVFIESICDDPDLVRENLLLKVTGNPNNAHGNVEEEMENLIKRCHKYEEQYETIDDDSTSYIKIYNLSSKMILNHVYGRMATSIAPSLMAWNIGTRPIYLTLTGSNATESDRETRKVLLTSKKGSLDAAGIAFRDALHKFMREECRDFISRRHNAINHKRNKILYKSQSSSDLGNLMKSLTNYILEEDNDSTFPCHIATSTVPRACQTVMWGVGMPSQALSNLNPIDRGRFGGLTFEDIAEEHPEWYKKFEADPFHTRFPSGESFRDVMIRLEPMVISVEQQVEPVLIITHRSVLRVFLAYFRNSPVEECIRTELPKNIVYRFTPTKIGGWQESQQCILSADQTAGPNELSSHSYE